MDLSGSFPSAAWTSLDTARAWVRLVVVFNLLLAFNKLSLVFWDRVGILLNTSTCVLSAASNCASVTFALTETERCFCS